MLTKTIDSLFIATRYGIWGLGVLGILISILLAFANVALGVPSILLCIGILLLSITISIGLLPKQLVRYAILEKRFQIAFASGMLAVILVGVLYFTNNGFPALHFILI